MGDALMQYRHEIGHAPAKLAPEAVLSEKLQYLCFSQVPAGSDCPYYSPILHQSLPLIVYTVLHFIGFRQVLAEFDVLLPCLYYIYRFNSLIVTVLHFIGFR